MTEEEYSELLALTCEKIGADTSCCYDFKDLLSLVETRFAQLKDESEHPDSPKLGPWPTDEEINEYIASADRWVKECTNDDLHGYYLRGISATFTWLKQRVEGKTK